MSIYKKMSFACLICFIIFATTITAANSNNEAKMTPVKQQETAPQTIENKVNRFTAPETPVTAELPNRKVPSGFELIAENEKLKLHVDPATFAFTVTDKSSGYVWGSFPSEEEMNKAELNKEWKRTVRSPFMVEYFGEDSLTKEGTFFSLDGQVTETAPVEGGIRGTFQLNKIQVSFSLELRLEQDGLVVNLSSDSVKEEGPYKLASVQMYPFFGAVYKDSVPGYIFIPDGSGALIRFQNAHMRYDEPYKGKIYGTNEAIQTSEGWNDPEEVRIPVFGIVHGVKQNAFVTVIEDGKYNAQIIAYPSGINTDFYRVGASFVFRESYFQPTSKNMGGFVMYEKERDMQDKQLRYMFLSDQDADYIGMAKTYRNYLVERGVLAKQEESSDEMPIRIELLGAEVEPGLVGTELLSMTNFDQAKNILTEFQEDGINDIVAVYRGWGSGGLTGSNPSKFPAEKKLGGNDGLEKLQQELKEIGIPLYLHADYTQAYGNQKGFSVGDEAVRKPSNEIVELKNQSWFLSEKLRELTKTNYMNPKVAAEIAEKDLNQFKQLGIEHVAVDKTPGILFADYNTDNKMTRQQAAEQYQNLAAMLEGGMQGVSMYEPNEYMWGYADRIFDVAMNSSQFMFATDTVPFLQIVLHGYIEYYAPIANFYANPQEEMLRMIEYGAYPSYYLTHEPSWNLKDTPSSSLFTSSFEDWEGQVHEVYKQMNEALSQVKGAEMVDRQVWDWGVVSVTYSNGVQIIVNYNSQPVQVDGITVQGLDYAVKGGDHE